MLQFNKIKIEDAPILNEFFQAQSFGMCEYSVGAVYMWRDYHQTRFCVHDGFLTMRFEWKKEERTCYSFPISKEPRDQAERKAFLEKLRAYAMEENNELVLVSVPSEAIEFLEQEFDVKSTVAKREWADYVYHYEDLAEMKGRKYSSKRNHIKNFIKNYPGYSVNKITKDNVQRVKAEYQKYFLERFFDENGSEYKNAESEETVMALAEMHQLGLTGIFVEAAGRIAGFSIGEVVGETLVAHVEKALTEYSGIYTFICREYARASYQEGLKYINREEDVGSEGLRKSKLSYHPAFLLDKHMVQIQ